MSKREKKTVVVSQSIAPQLLATFLQYGKLLVTKAFLDCLHRRQKSAVTSILPSIAEHKDKHSSFETKYPLPFTIMPKINFFDLLQHQCTLFNNSLKNRISLLLFLGSVKLVGAQCPVVYSCPEDMLPVPTAGNGCNTSSFVTAFNATFNFTCELMDSLSQAEATSLFTNASRACFYDGVSQSTIDDSVAALFYSNSTLCNSTDSEVLHSSSFNPLWLLLLLVLVPVGGYLCWRDSAIEKRLKTFLNTYQDDQRQREEEAERGILDVQQGYGARGNAVGFDFDEEHRPSVSRL